MVLYIVLILFAIYIVYNLIIVRSQMRLILEHLNIDETLNISDEVIDREIGNDIFDELNNPN